MITVKEQDNKVRNEPVLKKKLNGLDNQRILFWIDDENLITVEEPKETTEEMPDKNLVLYSYKLESETKTEIATEILNENNISTIFGYKYGIILLGNTGKRFRYDTKERKL